MSRPAHADACRDFRWKDTLRVLGWAPDGPVDLAATIVDRHAGHGRPGLRWIGKSGAARTLSFEELPRLSAQVAAWLRSRGVREGDRVAGFLPRVPETIAIMLGTWRAGGVYVPIFTGFGSDAIEFRLRDSGARVLCTHWEYRAKIPALAPGGPAVLTISGTGSCAAGDVGFHAAIEGQPADVRRSERPRGDPLHVGLDWPSQGRADRCELPGRRASLDALRGRPSPRRRLLAHGRSGLGLRADLLHARPRPRRARDLSRGDADARVRSPAGERGRRHQPRHDTHAPARHHGPARGDVGALARPPARGEQLRGAAQRRGRDLL